MNLAEGIADFTCILVQPASSDGLNDGVFRVRFGCFSFGFSPHTDRTDAAPVLFREPVAGAASGVGRRVAIFGQSLPRIVKHGGSAE